MADSKYRWQFAARFRRNAFGWRSQPAIARVHEAVVEIRKVARRDPVLVQYLQKRLIPTELARRAELNHLAALRSDRIRTAATSIHPWENNALGRLRTLELVQGRGELRASDNLFERGVE
jgi:hypothetical protein